MRNKILILFSALMLLGTLGAMCQTNVVVQSTNGTQQTYSIADNGKLYFSDGNIVIYDGSQEALIPMSEIQKIYFAQNSSEVFLPYDKQASITLYPNPATNSISLKNLTNGSMVSIYSMEGRLLLNKQCSNNESIDISGLQKGFYVVRVINKSFKLIKQ